MYQSVISFIKDLYGNLEFVPLSVPKFIGNEKKYLDDCINTTFVSSVGQYVDRFEKDIAAYTGAKRAVVCVSGTNALHLAYEEFYVPGEKINMERFTALGVVEETTRRPMPEVNAFFDKLEAIFHKEDFTKVQVVEAIKEFIPNFEHEEKGKNLDQKM